MNHEIENLQLRLETALAEKKELEEEIKIVRSKLMKSLVKDSRVLNWIGDLIKYIEINSNEGEIKALPINIKIDRLLDILGNKKEN